MVRHIPRYSIFLLALMLVCPDADGTSPSRGVTLPGDVILGGLFPVHEKSKDNTIACGQKVYNRGIQRLEAMLYAVDTINKDPTLLKGIQLGVNILDTCGRDTYALNQSLEFIRASLNTFDVSQYECSRGGTPHLKFNTSGPILGVIGGSYSSVSIQVANLLRLFRIPQISPASTAKALSDKSRFEMFARTVPPDTFQAIALVDIVKKFNWTYVSTIASEGSYGESGIDVFQREAEKRNICIAIAEKVPSDANTEKFMEVVANLLKKPTAKVVVLFTRAEDARGILMAARQLSSQGAAKFHFLASDGWGKQAQVVAGVEDFAVGAITVELESKRIQGFDEYMNRQNPSTNRHNPWFQDYWQDMFDCNVHPGNSDFFSGDFEESEKKKGGWLGGPGGGLSRWVEDGSSEGGHVETAAVETLFRKTCDPNLRLGNLRKYEQDSKVQFVIDAVYAFAHALEKQRRDLCRPGEESLCDTMKGYDRGEFYKNYLLKVDFQDIANSTVKFDEKGDGLARYTIYNYQRNSNGKTDYRVIGKWYNALKMDVDDVMWTSPEDFSTTSTPSSSRTDLSSLTSPATTITEPLMSRKGEIPTSVCSMPCKTGEIMIMNTGDTCCWICQKCQPYEYMKSKFECEDCGDGGWPFENKTSCYQLPLKYMRWGSVFTLVPVSISVVGIVLTVATMAIFVRYRETPLVRASGRELTVVLLSGLLLCYINTFVLLAKPGVVMCLLQRFTVGMSFSVVYGALLTKTNRISRIFHSAAHSARRTSYISPRSQLIITAVLVSVQFGATLFWVISAFPGAHKVYPERDEVILKCNVNDSSFLISQLYNMLLISVCTYYAIKTRKVPENFNEAKFIGFTMYTTCVIWLAFIPIYFGTGNSFEIQIMTLCISISLSAYVTLFCLFSPKLYIIVFQPEKNVRKLTMNSAVYKKTTTSLIIADFTGSVATAAIAANTLASGRTSSAVAANQIAAATIMDSTATAATTQALGKSPIEETDEEEQLLAMTTTVLEPKSHKSSGNGNPCASSAKSSTSPSASAVPPVGPQSAPSETVVNVTVNLLADAEEEKPSPVEPLKSNSGNVPNRPKRISFAEDGGGGAEGGSGQGGGTMSTGGSGAGTPCSVCERCKSSSNSAFEDSEDDDDDECEEEEGPSQELRECGCTEPQHLPPEAASTTCNGGLQQQQQKDAAAAAAAEEPSEEADGGGGASFHPPNWLSRARFASLPRYVKGTNSGNGAGGQAAARLLDSVGGDSGGNSSLSLNESPRHVVTYVTSSMETIPVEVNQDIPDVEL